MYGSERVPPPTILSIKLGSVYSDNRIGRGVNSMGYAIVYRVQQRDDASVLG